MDYILFGMGYGASLMLLGWALRTFGPTWKYADVVSDDEADQIVRKRFWNRFIQGLGGMLAISGTIIVFLTFLIMLFNPDDGTGARLALVIWASIAAVVICWSWMYHSRFGSIGIWSREDGYGFRSPANASRLSTSRRREQSAPNEESMAAEIPSPDPVETGRISESHDSLKPAFDHTSTTDVAEEMSPEQPTSDADFDPEYDFGDSEDVTVPSEPSGREEALRRLQDRKARAGHHTE